MTVSELDRLSLEIGRLQAGNENAREERTEIRRQLRAINENLAQLNLGVAQAATTLAEIKPKLEETRAARWTGRGVLTGVALGSGAIGAKGLALLGWLGR